MKNVLINKEKWEKLIEAVEYVATCQQMRGSHQGQYKRILSMPDFVESDEDVEVVAKSIYMKDYPNGGSIYKTWESLPYQDQKLYKSEAQAAINALKGGK